MADETTSRDMGGSDGARLSELDRSGAIDESGARSGAIVGGGAGSAEAMVSDGADDFPRNTDEAASGVRDSEARGLGDVGTTEEQASEGATGGASVAGISASVADAVTGGHMDRADRSDDEGDAIS